MGKRHHQFNILPFMAAILVILCIVAAVVCFPGRKGEQKGQINESAQIKETSVEPDFMVKNSVGLTRGEAEKGESETDESEPLPSASDAAADESSTSISDQARTILYEMSLEEKVGQMFIARCPEEQAKQKTIKYKPGGYILSARDFEGKTPEEVTSEIQSYQASSSIPMLIGVDEEGGTVTRVSRYSAFRSSPFLSPQQLYENGGFEAVRSDTVEKSRLLKRLGINVNFAPVCDVSDNPDDFIHARSFGKDAGQTAQYVETVVRTMKDQGIGSVLKHFPGYGNNADTHTGIAYDNRPYETFQTSDFLPFQAGIDSGADMVLVSHNIVKCMDEKVPASLSPGVHEILRNELGFTGVIVTDDLVMDGVREFADDARIAVMAVQAGNDLLCCTDFEVQIPAVLEAVKNGEISEQRIEESVLRILNMKIAMGIL